MGNGSSNMINNDAKEFYRIFDTKSKDKKLKSKIQQNLKILKSDFKLILSNLIFDKDESRVLAETFEECNSVKSGLKTLSIKNTFFETNSLKSLCKSLKQTKSLQHLDLSQNIQFHSQFGEIVSLLPELKLITNLNLSQIQINDTMAKQVFEAMSTHQNIGLVDLTKNLITDDSLESIKNFILGVTSLRVLKLENNKIEEKKVDQLREVFNEKFEKQKSFTPTEMLPSKRFDYSICETVGIRPSMEDVSVCMGSFRGRVDEDLFAVFDGHGGIEAAAFVAEKFPEILKEELDKDDSDVEQCLENTFILVDKLMDEFEMVGCTAAVCFIKGEKIFSFNCGDARTVVCETEKAIRLSFDHKPNLSEEIERIKNLGGFIERGRVQGVLAVSRSFGDSKMKPYIICTPYKKVYDINSSTTHVIVACDGIWDVVSDEASLTVVKKHLVPDKITKSLKDRALAFESMDNISVIVIQINPRLDPKEDEQEKVKLEEDIKSNEEKNMSEKDIGVELLSSHEEDNE